MELSQRARVRAGDHDEFGLLFEEHARAVYNHAFRLTGNWSAAEEVVSLTFLEAWRLRGTVRPEPRGPNVSTTADTPALPAPATTSFSRMSPHF